MNTPAVASVVDVLTLIFYVVACLFMLGTIYELIRWRNDR
jgi:hypothetical protein